MKTTWRDYLRSTAVIALLALAALGVVFMVKPWTYRWLGDYRVLANAAIGLLAYGLLSALLLRLMLALRPAEVGVHAVGSPAFSRWMLLTVVWRLGQGALRPFVPQIMKPVLDALFGARIGSDVAFGGTIDDPYLVSVGDGSVLGNASLVSANYIEEGQLVVARVTIGRGVTIGANAIVLPGSSIGDGATLTTGACLMPNAVVPAGDVWRGNPARPWKPGRGAPPAP